MQDSSARRPTLPAGAAGAGARSRLAARSLRADASSTITVDDDRSTGRLRLIAYPSPDVATAWEHGLDVAVTTHADAVALPLVRGGPQGKHVVGAIHDADGTLIAATTRAKGNRAWSRNPERVTRPATTAATRLEGHTFFGGHLRHAFGHLLLETLPRFWPTLDQGAYDRVLFYPTRPDQRRTRPSFEPVEVALLEALGVDPTAAVVVGDEPLLLDAVTVPTPALVLQHAVDDAVIAAFDRVAASLTRVPPAARGRRVYLSRTHLPDHYRGADNEPEIEHLVRAVGFDVVHPQELSLAEQVDLMTSASAVAGCDGSALHLAAFARPGTTLLAIDSRVVMNQFMLDAVRGLDAVHVLAVDVPVEGRTARWRADIGRVRRALDVAGLG